MDATLKMWGPAILIIVIEHTMNDSRSVRKSVLIGYILSIVCLKLNRFSHLSFMQYMGLYPGAVCIQLTHFSCGDCENTCTLSYYHHQIGSMTHFRLLRLWPWNSGMRYMPFYVLVFFFFIVICRHNSNIALINPLSKLELSQLHSRT